MRKALRSNNVKNLILGFLFFLLFAIAAHARTATFEWDAVVHPDCSGYKLYMTTTAGVYNDPAVMTFDGCATVMGVFSLPTTSGTYYFTLTAYSDSLDIESAHSNEVSADVTEPTKPFPPVLTGVVIQ